MDTENASKASSGLVLDSTAFYSGLPLVCSDPLYTTPSIISEISHRSVSELSLETLVGTGRLKIVDPSTTAIRTIEKNALDSGDSFKLSKADVELLALALDLQKEMMVTLISDDYSIQNLASTLNIRVAKGLSKGISRVARWLLYCRGCGKTFRGKNPLVCDICGTELSWKDLNK